MAGEAGRAVGHFLEALYLGFGEAPGEAELLNLARLPGVRSQAVVTKLTVVPTLHNLLDGKLPV